MDINNIKIEQITVTGKGPDGKPVQVNLLASVTPKQGICYCTEYIDGRPNVNVDPYVEATGDLATGMTGLITGLTPGLHYYAGPFFTNVFGIMEYGPRGGWVQQAGKTQAKVTFKFYPGYSGIGIEQIA